MLVRKKPLAAFGNVLVERRRASICVRTTTAHDDDSKCAKAHARSKPDARCRELTRPRLRKNNPSRRVWKHKFAPVVFYRAYRIATIARAPRPTYKRRALLCSATRWRRERTRLNLPRNITMRFALAFVATSNERTLFFINFKNEKYKGGTHWRREDEGR